MENKQDEDNIVHGGTIDPQVTTPSMGSSLDSPPVATPQVQQPAQPQPLQSSQQPVQQQPAQAPQSFSAAPAPVSAGGGVGSISKSAKPRWFLPALLLGLLLLGGGAAAYISVFQKSPESLWKSALANTADGIEEYLNNSITTEQKGFKTSAKFKVTSPIVVDGSMEGHFYGSNGSVKANIGAVGARIDTEVRAISPDSDTTPDIYLKVNGLEGVDNLIETFGGGSGSEVSTLLSSFNNQWYFLDHTLVDQYTATASDMAGENSSALDFSEEETKEIVDKMMAVFKERMFGTDDDKAVFKIAQKYGKEDFEGTASYKIRVKADKDNFKEFVTALKDAAKGTKLEELLKTGSSDKSLEEALSFDDLIKRLDEADFSDIQADVWVEGRGGYIRNVRIYPIEDKKEINYLDFGLDYKGGDVFPFLIRATIDDGLDKGTLSFGFQVNKINGDSKLTLNIDAMVSGTSVKAEGELSVNSTDEDVSVEKPEGSKNIFELIGDFQQGFLGGGVDYPYGTDENIVVPQDQFLLDDAEL